MRVMVPSMRPPPYQVAPGSDCAPPNDLPRHGGRERYVIVGAGKTGIDTCLWLLGYGIAPDRLTWVMPRDSWLLDRATIQPGSLFADRIKASFTAQLRAVRDAESVEDLFSRLEDSGALLRIDADKIVLDDGSVAMDGCALYIDCTADGAEKRPATPIFDTGRITLQSVRGCQQIFSAALVAHVETAYPDDTVKNQLCVPLPHPDTDLDWLRVALADYGNQLRWLADPDLTTWLAATRLDLFGHLMGHLLAPASAKPRVRDRILGMAKSALSATATKLDQLMVEEASLAAP